MSRRDNAANPETLKIRERLEKRRENRLRAGLKIVMSTPTGREFMWELVAKCGVYQSSFTGNSETFFREGRRDIGLYLTAMLMKDCVDEYALMQKEAVKRDEDERKELEPPEEGGDSIDQKPKER